MSRMQPDDPAYWMLTDDFTTTPEVYLEGCYICEDPEFAQMGLPLCKECPYCVINCDNCSGVDPTRCAMQRTDHGHVPADDEICDNCQRNVNPHKNPDVVRFYPWFEVSEHDRDIPAVGEYEEEPPF